MGEVVVTTPSGPVRGLRTASLEVFRGIPYARPPVGALRLLPPRPVAPWREERDATGFGHPSPQSRLFGPVQQGAPGRDRDDWLTLNVWSPRGGERPRPVLVWVYGGGYQVGAASSPAYDGSRIAVEGDVVVVTFDYRVGAEGFLHLDDAPPNRGLLDQVAALRWVHEHVEAFGGDPARVTVVGQSAGAGSVASLLTMPQTEHLFHRAVLQSVPRTFLDPPLARRVAVDLTASVGLAPTRAALAAVPPEELRDVSDAVARGLRGRLDRWGTLALMPTLYSPEVDGQVLPELPWSFLRGGARRSTPLVVGHTRDEYRLFMGLDPALASVTAEQTAAAVGRVAGTDVLAAYRGAHPAMGGRELYELFFSDWLLRMPSVDVADAHAGAGGPVHLYELAGDLSASPALSGAPHGCDVPLLFGTTGAAPDDPAGRLRQEVGERVRRAWTRFARTGDPGWAPYDRAARLTRVFDGLGRTTAYPEEVSRALWRSDTPAALTLPSPPAGT